MTELSTLRAKLKDRQHKDGALGAIDTPICLDMALIKELTSLQAERSNMAPTVVGDANSMIGRRTVDPDYTAIDARIAAKEQQIRENSILVRFRALLSPRYQSVVNSFDDPENTDKAAFFEELVAASFQDAWSDGEKTDLTWDEIRPATSFGEYDDICLKVFALNRRRQDIPFSLTRSRTTPPR